MKGFNRLKRVSNARSTVNHTERIDFARKIQTWRNLHIDRWYLLGGIIFQQWSEKNYMTNDGRLLSWDQCFMEELYIYIGHPWFERKIIEKAAQVGFTEAIIAYLAFCLAYLHIPVGFGAESRDKINMLVSDRIQPALDYVPAIQELSQQRQDLTKRKDSDNKKSLSVAGIIASFFYANVKGQRGMERQATSSLSSFTAYSIVADEFELWARGVLDIAEKRMQGTILPTQPIVAGSTPGAEGGITATEVKLAQYLFQWHIVCDSCGTEQFLSPLGNFLKAVNIEVEERWETRFTDPTGRPLDWFYHQETNKIETAYIGCPHCGEELGNKAISSGEFRCTKTHITLKDLVAQTLEEKTTIPYTALRLPRLATSNFNPSKIMTKLLNSDNPIDELQQGLGVPASISLGRINYERLLECVGLPLPETVIEYRKLRVLAIDQGKFSHPAMVQEWYIPDFNGEDNEEETTWIQAHKVILWYGELANLNEAITAVAKEWDVDITVMDADPEFTQSTSYAVGRQPKEVDKNQVYLVDQVSLKGEKYKRKVVQTSTAEDSEVILYSIDRTYCCDRVRDRIYRQLQHFPDGEYYDPENKQHNLFAHYLSSERLPTGRWLEDSGSHDHLFMTDSFAEIVVLIDMFEPGHGGLFFTSIDI